MQLIVRNGVISTMGLQVYTLNPKPIRFVSVPTAVVGESLRLAVRAPNGSGFRV